MDEQSNIIIYQTEDGQARIAVHFEDETVWLTQQQMADLFQTSRTNVVEHIRHIHEEGELDEAATCRKFRQVRQEGARQVERSLPHYNLDLILSLGYRVKSTVATRFRRWATGVLKEYLVRGVAANRERLRQLGQAVEVMRRTADRSRRTTAFPTATSGSRPPSSSTTSSATGCCSARTAPSASPTTPSSPSPS